MTRDELLALAEEAEKVADEIDANPNDPLAGYQDLIRSRAAHLRAKASAGTTPTKNKIGNRLP